LRLQRRCLSCLLPGGVGTEVSRLEDGFRSTVDIPRSELAVTVKMGNGPTPRRSS
jgi:hypothetical protein